MTVFDVGKAGSNGCGLETCHLFLREVKYQTTLIVNALLLFTSSSSDRFRKGWGKGGGVGRGLGRDTGQT